MADALRILLTDEQLELVADLVVERLRSHVAAASNNAQPEVLLSRAQLAAALGLSLSTIDRLVRQGIPCTRVGSVKRFDLAAVRSWLEHRGGRRAAGGRR